MHPRNPYQSKPPDFARLAAAFPDAFGPFVQSTHAGGHPHIDFQDPEAVRALNHVLLLHDFGIHAQQPPDKLCPGIPNRLNYLLWLQDILQASLDSHGRPVVEFHHGIQPPSPVNASREGDVTGDDSDEPRKRRKVEHPSHDEWKADGSEARHIPTTLDIGTGATAVYPLLGCAISPLWRFLGTDIDQSSLQSARSILQDARNEGSAGRDTSRSFHSEPLKLRSRISLLLRCSDDFLIPTAAEVAQTDKTGTRLPLFHATMCNPPFYRDVADMQCSLAAKKEPPHAVCSGTAGEMITPGGEVAFVRRLLRESLARRQDVTWYTSMLGKLSSVSEIVQDLSANAIDNYAVTELVQGRTKRWAVAWSFALHRLPDDVARAANVSQLPACNALVRVLPCGLGEASTAIRTLVRSLQGAAIDDYQRHVAHGDEDGTKAVPQSFHIRLAFNSWNRAARRSKHKQSQREEESATAQEQDEPLLCVLCHLTAQCDPGGEAAAAPPISAPNVVGCRAVQVRIQWTYGYSRKDFMSFCTMLFRKLDPGAVTDQGAKQPSQGAAQ